MMAGNPNWWGMNSGMHPQSHHQLSSPFVYGSSSPLSSSNPSPDDGQYLHPNGQDFPIRSWSQPPLGGLGINGEERFGANYLFQQQKKHEINWDEQILNVNPSSFTTRLVNPIIDVKQEVSQSQFHGHLDDNEIIHANRPNSNSWPSYHQIVPLVYSPTSCTTTLSNDILNFSDGKSRYQQHNQDHSSECNSTGAGGASKKARVTQFSAQPALKVRKEKLGDRITALHQLVSPFGKTDTASVLSEAIGYIRFLQGQIEALSTPYMGNASGSTRRYHQHYVEERNWLFPDEHGQFLNDVGIEGRGASNQDSQGRSGVKDLRSRGLCLVPISCTQHIGNENCADYWAPAALGGGF